MGGVPTRVLITGGAGIVARALVATRPSNVEVVVTRRSGAVPSAVDSHQVELTDVAAVEQLVESVRPGLVLHTAASTTVEADVVDAADVVAGICAATGTELVHLSSDMVFAGTGSVSEHDGVDPVNEYGRWKAQAERRVLRHVSDACITRTSLVVSLDPLDRGTARLFAGVDAEERPSMFHDELRCPIRAADLAIELWKLSELSRATRSGVWHLPGPEVLSRMELARALLTASGRDPARLTAASVHDHPSPRPPDLRLTSARRHVLGHPPESVRTWSSRIPSRPRHVGTVSGDGQEAQG